MAANEDQAERLPMVDATMPLHVDINLAMETSQSAPLSPSTPGGSFKLTPSASAVLQKRRSSTRSIKRKKFDDELVESSLAKTDRRRFPSTSSMTNTLSPVVQSPVSTAAPVTTASSVPVQPLAQVTAPITSAAPLPVTGPDIKPVPTTPEALLITTVSAPLPQPTSSIVTAPSMLPALPSTSAVPTDYPIPTLPLPTPVVPPEKKKPKSSSKRSKKSKPPPAGSTKDLGRWKPQDDLALINAIQQTCDLNAVFHGVKFSCKFTLKEIQERWYALMYDSVLSKLAVQAIKQLHPDVVAEIQTKALYSKDEELSLKKITSTSQPTLDTFSDILEKNPTVFHVGRTPKTLHNHWMLMKQYHLLPDQSVPPMPKGDHVLNFSDAEDMINEDELREPRDDALEHELTVADRRQKREIRHVEQELPKWQVLVDSVTGISPPDFDNQTLAVLRGRLVRYLMRSREITLGRATKDNQIDVDLSLEGPAWKISRRQGMIKLKSNGDFYIANEGKRPLYIDSKPVLMGSKQKLNNNSVVEISCLRFIFLINQDLINVIRQETQKISS